MTRNSGVGESCRLSGSGNCLIESHRNYRGKQLLELLVRSRRTQVLRGAKVTMEVPRLRGSHPTLAEEVDSETICLCSYSSSERAFPEQWNGSRYSGCAPPEYGTVSRSERLEIMSIFFVSNSYFLSPETAEGFMLCCALFAL